MATDGEETQDIARQERFEAGIAVLGWYTKQKRFKVRAYGDRILLFDGPTAISPSTGEGPWKSGLAAMLYALGVALHA